MKNNTIKHYLKSGLYATIALAVMSCTDDDGDGNPTPEAGRYVLGLGVTTPESTTNYVLQASDLTSGTLSLINQGILQEGYRDYTQVGPYFYSVGGLGVTDANVYYLDENGQLASKTGLTFPASPVDFKDADGQGKTLLSVIAPASAENGTDVQFVLVDAASNAITKNATVPIDDIYPTSEDWLMHTGIVVRGNQAFQTFCPINSETYKTQNTDAVYVAVYSYPDFQLQEVLEDPRTGPAGAFGTRSGIFVTESGDIYTVSHNGYGYSQSTKDAAILKIPAGSADFDNGYHFNTATADNGGRIVHAIYIGGNKLFAEISSGAWEGQWVDSNLKFAIVDLAEQKITAVEGSPTFTGDGGRSFAAMHHNGKAYAAATVGGVCNIYEIDVATATATKGAVVDATFMGGIGRF